MNLIRSYFLILACAASGFPGSALASSSMVGGKSVAASSWIAHTVVALVASGKRGQSLCTASVVASDLAVTAAHCVTSEVRGEKLALSLVFSTHIKKAT